MIADLQALKYPGVRYSAFMLEDGKTFIHFAMYPNEETATIVPNLESFQSIREQLKDSQPEVPPKSEDLTLVGSAYKIVG